MTDIDGSILEKTIKKDEKTIFGLLQNDDGSYDYFAQITDENSIRLQNVPFDEAQKLLGENILAEITDYFKNKKVFIGSKKVTIGEAIANSRYARDYEVQQIAAEIVDKIMFDKKAYIRLVQALHPDKNPNIDPTLMPFINQLKDFKDKYL